MRRCLPQERRFSEPSPEGGKPTIQVNHAMRTSEDPLING